MSSLLLQFKAEPPAEIFAQARGGAQRLEILRRFYERLKRGLRLELGKYPVEVTDLDAMGAVVVRGPPGTLKQLMRPGGKLDELGVTVAENVDFVPLAE